MPLKEKLTSNEYYEKYKETMRRSAAVYSGEGADKSKAVVESVRLRVPNGMKKLIEEKAASEKKSVNDFICILIADKLNVNLDELKKQAKQKAKEARMLDGQ